MTRMKSQVPIIQAILREEDIALSISSVGAKGRDACGQSLWLGLKINKRRPQPRKGATPDFKLWRRRRDSNPRDPSGPNGFQDRSIQPLCHSSAVILLHLWKPALHILHLFFHFPGTNETNR